MGWAKDFATGLSSGLAEPIKELISEFITDKDKAAELAHAVTMKIMERAENDAQRENNLLMNQLEINKIEATSGSLFVAGGRPAIIWICAAGLFQMLVLFPLISFFYSMYKSFETGALVITTPPVDTMLMISILGPLLGISTQRMVETLIGKQRNRLAKKEKR